MRISWLPRYSEAAASSRIRVYSIHRQLSAWGYDSVIGWNPDADVLVVQKHEDDEAFERAAAFHGLVVYDFDDLISEHAIERAVCVADLITTDTKGHLAAALRYLARVRAAILPDGIDYYPTQLSDPSEGRGAVWYGWPANYASVRWMTDALVGAGVPVTTICDHPVDDRTAFRHWSVAKCPGDLRSSGVAILSHRGGDRGKSANKMITAIAFGLPCIVGDSFEYEDLAREMEVDWSIVESASDVVDMYARLSNTRLRRQYLQAAQPYVWDRFSPAACARRFLEAVS